jgi:hypothetical protein
MGQTTFTTSFVSGTGDSGSGSGSGNGTSTMTGQPMGRQPRRVEARSRKRHLDKKEGKKASTSDQYGLAGGQEHRGRGEGLAG